MGKGKKTPIGKSRGDLLGLYGKDFEGLSGEKEPVRGGIWGGEKSQKKTLRGALLFGEIYSIGILSQVKNGRGKFRRVGEMTI